MIQRANKYIDETAPGPQDMEKNKAPRLAHVLYNLLETTRICGILLSPFMPESCDKLFAQIGAGADVRTWARRCLGQPAGGRRRHQGREPLPPIDAGEGPSPSWRSWKPRPGRPRCPPWRWSPSSRRRWTSTPSASPISGW